MAVQSQETLVMIVTPVSARAVDALDATYDVKGWRVERRMEKHLVYILSVEMSKKNKEMRVFLVHARL